MKVPVLLITACLAGCATHIAPFQGEGSAQLRKELDAFQGKPVSGMIAKFGQPQEQREADGERWLTWREDEESFARGYWMGFENDSTYQVRCQIIAQVRGETVVQVAHQGNLENCRFLGLI